MTTAASVAQIARNTFSTSPTAYNSASTSDILVARYGVLIDLGQLAEILRRSQNGVRVSLRSSQPWAQRVNSTRVRLGRRVYFRTAGIAAILDEGDVR